MVVGNDEHEEDNEVEFRDHDKEPCSVSGYGDLQCKAAHDALVEASQALLPLADYIEQNFSQDLTENKINTQLFNGHEEESITLQGGDTLLQGGEYLIQAVNAVACNVAALAESLNEKLTSLNEDIKRMSHDVELADSGMKIYQHREALNKIKNLTVKKDTKHEENPGPIVRVGEFTAITKYVRKRIDFNIFDDIGHGHKIHATSFSMNPLERQQSADMNDHFKEFDTGSNSGGSFFTNNSTLGRRRSSITSNHVGRASYLTLGKGVDKRATTTSAMKFPAVPSSFPKAPTSSGGASFPVIPESPPPPQYQEIFRRDSFDPEQLPLPDNIFEADELSKPNERKSLGLPPPPDSPPPELPPPSDEPGIDDTEEDEDIIFRNSDENQSDSRPTSRSNSSRLSMLPVPDFEELGMEGMDTIREE